MIDQLIKLIQPLKNKISLLASRGNVTSVKDGPIQKIQLSMLAGEIKEKISRLQNYGFKSNPKPGAEALTIFLNGDRKHGIAIVVDDKRYVLELASGEVAMFTDEGDCIHMKRGKLINIKTNTLKIDALTKVEINSPLIEASGKIEAGGDIETDASIKAAVNVEDAAGTMAEQRTKYNIHLHPVGAPNSGPPTVPMD